MNLICIPFAYEENMNSGVNVSIKGKGKIEIYLKNACVALISAKYYNPDSDVALVTNLDFKVVIHGRLHFISFAS